MKNPTLSILVFGIYIIIVGLTLLIVPNLLLSLFGLSSSDVWVRVLGILAFVLGLYYVQASREKLTAFYRMTLWGRVAFAAGLIGLVVAGQSSWPLALFGGVDLLGAAWTWYALR